MEIDFKEYIKSPSYDFLRTNEHLKDHIILLTLGGSYAYGTNKSDGTSDVDIRGIVLNSKKELLTNVKFEQFTNDATDTVIYSLKKIVSLLSECNPNTIEILGCKKEHYLYLNETGESLLQNKSMFLSKKAAFSFSGYASQQLRRLENLTVRNLSQARQEEHIYNSIMFALDDIKSHHESFPEDSLKLWIDKAINPMMDTEIFMDVSLRNYPLRDYENLWSELHSIVKSYQKIGKRNEKAIEHAKVGKHSMHLIRLYFMCLDILEKGEINTYREKEHDLLMDIRNGKFLNEDNVPNSAFYDMVSELEKKVKYAKENTDLPENPDYERINDWMYDVHEKIILGKLF